MFEEEQAGVDWFSWTWCIRHALWANSLDWFSHFASWQVGIPTDLSSRLQGQSQCVISILGSALDLVSYLVDVHIIIQLHHVHYSILTETILKFTTTSQVLTSKPTNCLAYTSSFLPTGSCHWQLHKQDMWAEVYVNSCHNFLTICPSIYTW